MADGMPEDEQKPVGSWYLFNGDAQAILEESPNLDFGLSLLREAYNERAWDDAEKARSIAAEYAQNLRYRFEDKPEYDASDIVNLAPIDLAEIPITEEGKTKQLTDWEEANTQFLDETDDADYLIVRDKLKNNIKDYASQLRRETQRGKQGAITDAFYRASLGLTGGIAKLVGAEEYIHNLQEQQDPSRDDDFSSALASGAGSFVGAVGAGVVGAAAGFATAGPPGAVIGAKIGAGGYLGLTGAGEVRETVEESLEKTGDSGRATIAGTIEGTSQALQTIVGGKVFGSTGRLLAQRIWKEGAERAIGSTVGQVGSKALLEGTSEGVGNVISNYADKYGTKSSKIDIFDDTGTNFLVGTIFGSVAGGIDVIATKSNPKVDDGVNTVTGVTPPIERGVVGSNVDVARTTALQSNLTAINTNENGDVAPPPQGDFVTEDGSTYSLTDDNATFRYKPSTESVLQPFDRTFFISKENAAKVASLRDTVMPDGKPAQITTDGERLIIKSEFINQNLEPTTAPTGRTITYVEADTEPTVGTHPVEVNSPRNPNGNQIEYRSHIGQAIKEVTPRVTDVPVGRGGSVGAALTRETKLGKRLRLNKDLHESIRSGFGDEEFGFVRYMQQPRAESTSLAETHVGEIGIENATTEFLELPPEYASAEAMETGRYLEKHYNEGAKRAVDAGDTASAENMAHIAVWVGQKAAQMATNAGQTVDITRLWQNLSPEIRILNVKKLLGDASLKEVAVETGQTIPELTTAERRLAKLEAWVKTLPQDKAKNIPPVVPPDIQAEIDRLQDIKSKIQAARKKHQDKFAPEQQKKMRDFLVAASTTSGSTQRDLLLGALEIERDVGTANGLSAASNLETYWILNALGDLSAQAINVGATAAELVGNISSLAVTGVPRGNLDFTTFLKGTAGALREARLSAKAELKGIKTFRPQAGKLADSGSIGAKNLIDRPDWIKTAPKILQRTKLNYMGIIFRLLSSPDAFFYKLNVGGMARMLAEEHGKKQGLSKKSLKTYVSEQLFNSPEHAAVALEQAKKESDLLKSLGRPTSKLQTELRAYEIMEEQRPAYLREITHNYASRATFTNTPDGVAGIVVNAFKTLTQGEIPIKGVNANPFPYIFPFLNIGGNVANAMLNYTPVGAARAAGLGDLPPIERRLDAGKFMIGMMATGGILAKAMQYLDDEDPYIAIYGYGPTDPAQRKQWIESGAKPFSLKIGKRYLRFVETPLGMNLGFLGSYMDLKRYNKAYARQSSTGAFMMATIGMGRTFLDHTFLSGLADILDVFGDTPSESKVNALENLLIRPVKNFIPSSGTLKMASKLVSDPIDTYNDIWAKFVSGIPFVEGIGTEPALNAFGEPVERTLEDRLSFISRFYSERVTDPNWRWLAENGYTIPDFGVELATEKRERVKESRAERLGAAFEGIMTREERRAFTIRQGPALKQLITEYRQYHGSSGYQKEVQENLSKDIGELRSRIRDEMFLQD